MKFRHRLKDREWPHTSDDPLPARFNFGDPVVVYFGTAGIIQNCTIIKVHFTESKVSYDVEVKWKHIDSADLYSAGVDKEREITDRLYNLDSGVVFSPEDFDEAESKPQKHSNFTVRLKAHVEKCLKKSGMTTLFLDSPPYHERETIRRAFMDSLGEGAIDALQVSGCVEKYIPKQNRES